MALRSFCSVALMMQIAESRAASILCVWMLRDSTFRAPLVLLFSLYSEIKPFSSASCL